MRVLFVAEAGHYKRWGPKNYYDLLEYVSKNNKEHEILLIYTDNKSETIKEELTIFNPDIILFFDTDTFSDRLERFKFLFKFKKPIGLILLDMFYPNKLKDNIFIKKIHVLVHFGKAHKIVDYYKNLYKKKYVTFLKSRFINKRRFYDYKEKKEYDIVFYGTRRYYHDYASEKIPFMGQGTSGEVNFYPLRERLENLLKDNKKYKVLVLPEKNSYTSQIKNEDLSLLLNKSKMAVACSTLADICMHKYMEILASHCMVLGDIPSDYQKMMKDKICEVTLSMTDEQILDKIDSYLNNTRKLERLTDELYNEIHTGHNYDEAIKNFNVLFENIIKNIKI